MKESWVCCQLGAREHYSIPRAVNHAGALALFITDLWARPGSLLHSFPAATVRERYHSDLQTARVDSMNWRALAFETAARVRWRGWDRILARNQWFGQQARRELGKLRSKGAKSVVVFSYSYTARDVFQFAKQSGWTTVLGQIDAGAADEQLIRDAHRQVDGNDPPRTNIPSTYWERWREECALADHIVVNSPWSRTALLSAGIAGEKINVIPLAYEQPLVATPPPKEYPAAFSTTRPLRILFLGSVSARKGIYLMLDALRVLQGAPVEFRVVGPIHMPAPRRFANHAALQFIGPVPRSEVARHYQWADVFAFPTYSDGFGLTQLEAQFWKVPVIASCFCGDVVTDGQNGRLLDELSGDAIAQAIQAFLREPQSLEAMSAASGVGQRFTIPSLAEQLISLVACKAERGN